MVSRKEFDCLMLGGFTNGKKIGTFNNAHKLHGKSEFWREPDKREKTLEFADYYDESVTKIIRHEECGTARRRLNPLKSVSLDDHQRL